MQDESTLPLVTTSLVRASTIVKGFWQLYRSRAVTGEVDSQPTFVDINDVLRFIVNMNSRKLAKVAKERSREDMRSHPNGAPLPKILNRKSGFIQTLDNSKDLRPPVGGKKNGRNRGVCRIPLGHPFQIPEPPTECEPFGQTCSYRMGGVSHYIPITLLAFSAPKPSSVTIPEAYTKTSVLPLRLRASSARRCFSFSQYVPNRMTNL